MHVGYAPLFQNPENERTDYEVYSEELRLAELAEPLDEPARLAGSGSR
jgi:hypothetical protein